MDMRERSAEVRGVQRRGGVLPASIPCHRCGTFFKPYSVVSRYCSKLCRGRGRNANRARRWAIKRRAIYDRDGGTCQLCYQPVDLSLAYPHPKAFTVDHVVPVTGGGTDDESNLQAAHMECNSRKGGVIQRTALSQMAA